MLWCFAKTQNTVATMTRMINAAITNPPIEPTITASGSGWTAAGAGVTEAIPVGVNFVTTEVAFKNDPNDVVEDMGWKELVALLRVGKRTSNKKFRSYH